MSPVTHHLNATQANFRTVRTQYLITMTRDEVLYLETMISGMIQAAMEDLELELLVLIELRLQLTKKYFTCAANTSMKLPPSQARTLFVWLNEIPFSDPLQKILAYRLVDQIYKQIV